MKIGIADNNYGDSFFTYVMALIRSMMIKSISRTKRYQPLFSSYIKAITVESVITQAAATLVRYNFGDRVVIDINESIYFENTQIKLIDLCRILNYGTLNQPGSHVFSDIFNFIADNINDIYLDYITETRW